MSSLQQSFWTGSITPVAHEKSVVQVGALCMRQTKRHVEVLLVKSSRGRWIIPKGWPMDGLTDAQAAKVEAWEEAGVDKCKVSKAPIGGYATEKRFDDGTRVPCNVTVYRLDVQHMVKRYPEAGMRKRKWFSLKQAIRKADDPGLTRILQTLRGDHRAKQ